MKKYKLAIYINEIRILDYINRLVYTSSDRYSKIMSFEQAHLSQYKYYPDILITEEMVQLFLSKDQIIVDMIEEVLLNKTNGNNTNTQKKKFQRNTPRPRRNQKFQSNIQIKRRFYGIPNYRN